MKRVAIFASGSGTNFECLVNEKYNNIEIALLVCDKADAYVIERATKHNVEAFIISQKDYESKEAFEEVIVEKLHGLNIDFICLAGYMRYIGNVLLNAYANKIINIHPALLPSFKGAHGIKDAYEYGVKIMGVTIHYVNLGIDEGKIIAQDCFHLNNETLEEAEAKIHEIEHRLYPKTLKELLED